MKYIQVVICYLFLLFGCDQNKHIRTYRLPKIPKNILESSINIKDDMESRFKWDKPESWIEVEGHSMRLASFQVPYTDGIGDLSITTLAKESGSILANVNRWLGQIGVGPVSSKDIDSLTQIRIGQIGQFLFFKLIKSSKSDAAILAAIFELEHKTLFIKLTAETIGIKENEVAFIKFCESVSFVNKYD